MKASTKKKINKFFNEEEKNDEIFKRELKTNWKKILLINIIRTIVFGAIFYICMHYGIFGLLDELRKLGYTKEAMIALLPCALIIYTTIDVEKIALNITKKDNKNVK